MQSKLNTTQSKMLIDLCYTKLILTNGQWPIDIQLLISEGLIGFCWILKNDASLDEILLEFNGMGRKRRRTHFYLYLYLSLINADLQTMRVDIICDSIILCSAPWATFMLIHV